jgi:hypothetical protein
MIGIAVEESVFLEAVTVEDRVPVACMVAIVELI